MNTRIDGPACSARRLIGAAALATICVLASAASTWADVPDNRGPKLNPDDAVSPAYDETLQDRDGQRLDEALERGETFITTVHGAGQAPDDGLPLPVDYERELGNAQNAGPEPGARAARPAPVYETAILPRIGGPERNAGLDAMVRVLLENWTRPPQIVRLRYADPEDRGSDVVRTAVAPEPSAPRNDRARLPGIAAGQGFYARTLYAVASDYPGPVVLELLQPPLAGAVAHGGFERVGTRLVLRLTSLTWRGRTVPVDAWAVDPECACFGIEGEVDRHFLARVLLPAAARFAEGFMTAMAMPARTLTLNDGAVLHERDAAGERDAVYAGLGEASRSLGDILMADAPRETTVRIPRDTPLVVMVARPIAWAPAAVPDPGRREGSYAGN